jgi:hypothetical protein
MIKNNLILPLLCISISFILISCSASYITEKNGTYNITAKNAGWTIVFPSNDYTFKKNKNNTDERCYYLFKHKNYDIIVSVDVMPNYEFNDEKQFRDAEWENLKSTFSNAKNIVKTNYPGCALVEYLVPDAMGLIKDYKSMHAYYLKDGYEIILHVSKVLFKESDQRMFDDIFKSVRFDKSEVKKEEINIKDSISKATQYFVEKGIRYLKKDNVDKVQYYYQKAYENELKEPTLDNQLCNIILVQLAGLYGIKNDVDKSKEVMRYGLSRDSTYPMFYYTLACAYAETNDLNKCIENLRTAYKYKKYLSEDETIPDPRQDDSFQKYLDNEKFQQALKEIGA